jgi:hypothetical protein
MTSCAKGGIPSALQSAKQTDQANRPSKQALPEGNACFSFAPGFYGAEIPA